MELGISVANRPKGLEDGGELQGVPVFMAISGKDGYGHTTLVDSQGSAAVEVQARLMYERLQVFQSF